MGAEGSDTSDVGGLNTGPGTVSTSAPCSHGKAAVRVPLARLAWPGLARFPRRRPQGTPATTRNSDSGFRTPSATDTGPPPPDPARSPCDGGVDHLVTDVSVYG